MSDTSNPSPDSLDIISKSGFQGGHWWWSPLRIEKPQQESDEGPRAVEGRQASGGQGWPREGGAS
jgi:hypothetical protein